ncbi:amidohydrolase family protein [Chitinophaga pollutisoli]|uniref:Amidohydrolase family protein n=1 Tax=Chitinophaga pollutisoli TaxID=3133966 RepID=A0ABZ2YPB2_9BACT
MRNTIPALSLLILAAISCNRPTGQADQIFYNGDILTMAGDSAAYVEALVVKDGRIAFAGSRDAAMRMQGDSTMLNDLQGQALLPGFIDAHGHVTQYAAMSDVADLSPAPYGKVMSIPDLQLALKDYIARNNIPNGMPVIGNGYDDAIMQEHRHPTAAELDAVSATHPIYILHASGHMGVANSFLLKEMGITYQTPNPSGGVIGKNAATRQLTGKMEENANINSLLFLIAKVPRLPATRNLPRC